MTSLDTRMTPLLRAMAQANPGDVGRSSPLNAGNVTMMACAVAIGLVVVCGFLPL
jgi:hypothetical protein